jgi:hypothetical protein
MIETISNAARFYDHAKNHTNAAVAHAIARVRREVIADGTAYRVEANWKGQGRFYWNGGRYDALGLAKDLFRNRAENVVLTGPDGKPVDIESARY